MGGWKGQAKGASKGKGKNNSQNMFQVPMQQMVMPCGLHMQPMNYYPPQMMAKAGGRGKGSKGSKGSRGIGKG